MNYKNTRQYHEDRELSNFYKTRELSEFKEIDEVLKYEEKYVGNHPWEKLPPPCPIALKEIHDFEVKIEKYKIKIDFYEKKIALWKRYISVGNRKGGHCSRCETVDVNGFCGSGYD
jgi:hypothetical protein